MRDGILLAAGKGNTEWNNSAPHGSGRLLKREDVFKHYTLSQFKTQMKGVYCSCIGKNTLDEAPFAYRYLKTIAGQIRETADIQRILKPVYNYKAGSRQN